MPRIFGTWSRPAPAGGLWRIVTPRVNDPAGQPIIPPGVYDSGVLTVDTAAETTAIDVSFPDLPGSLPVGWRLKLIIDFDGDDHETYVLDVATSDVDIDLGDVVISEDLDEAPSSLARGIRGGVAALDADGDVVDADGNKLAAGGFDVRFPSGPTEPTYSGWLRWYQTDPDDPARIIDERSPA